ncbi:hypothetical protein V5S96_08610 [Corynebacterium mastitidis]|uniref:Uncharacterized protein n=1 Tax=Corynebacterium mastitidis TaxID=161890 RepID=A0ABU8NZI3_9CORY
MGLNPNPKHRNLADMSTPPPTFTYTPREADQTVATPIDLADGCELTMRESYRKGLIIDFSLNEHINSHHPRYPYVHNHDVARIDCCHSEVHRHQFYANGDEDPKYYVIRSLTDCPDQQTAEKVIDECYDHCYSMIMSNWEAHLERWDSWS